MSKHPKKVRIGPIDYAIQLVSNPTSDGRPIDGQVHNERAIIRLKSELGPQQMRQVLWHEIFHAVCYQGNMWRLRLTEERAIDPLAWAMVQLLRDNPWLGKEIT